MNEKNFKYPIRINRYLAIKGHATRRDADGLIVAGKIKINGKTAKLGDKVHEGDSVEIVNETKKNYIYLAFNKPVGVVTHSPQEGEKSIADILKIKEKVFPLGRLDKESYGLIILTNDGRATDRLLAPEYYHEKEYLVKVSKPLSPDFIRRMQKGVYIESYKTKPAILKTTGDKSFRLTLTEGKKHQIRRMCTALGYEVVELKRVRIMNIELKDLAPGKAREIKGKELIIFLKSLGL